MGAAKERLLQQQGQGWSFVDNAYVCSECVAEAFLRTWIAQNASWHTCTYCGRSSTGALAIPVNDLFTIVDEGLRTEYHDALDWYSYDSEDRRLVGHWVNSFDLLYELEVELFSNEKLADAFVNAFGDRMFCPAYPHSLSESESFHYGWDRFVHHVKHQARYYFFTEPPRKPAEGSLADERLSVAETPSYLGRAVRALGRVSEIGTQVDLFRARLSRSGEAFVTARDLGTVPEEFATAANRMSPSGIAMFYAAADEGTAVAEVYDRSKAPSETALASVGVFRPSRSLRVIDLSERGTLPSLFDKRKRYLREKMRVLSRFAAAIAQPVEKDSLEHIEYAPTQIVTEYFRHAFAAGDEERIDGIMYLSSCNPDHVCYVLFVDNSHCVDGDDMPRDEELRLVLHRTALSELGDAACGRAPTSKGGSRTLRRRTPSVARHGSPNE